MSTDNSYEEFVRLCRERNLNISEVKKFRRDHKN